MFEGLLQIRKVRNRGPFGGVIFSAATLEANPKRYVVKANWKMARSPSLFKDRHIWRVKGAVKDETIIWKDGTTANERVIEAESLTFEKAKNENLVKLLAQSSDFKGISDLKAEKLVECFGDGLIQIAIEGDIERLLPVVGRNVAERIISGLREYEQLGTLQLLDELGVPPRVGESVLEIWKNNAYEQIKKNPYFLTAFMADMHMVDGYAIDRLGRAPDSPQRLIAYTKDVLFKAFNSGHTCLPVNELRYRLKRTLPKSLDAAQAIEVAVAHEEIIFIGDYAQVKSMAIVEATVADIITKSQFRAVSDTLNKDLNHAIERYEKDSGIELTDEQTNAVFQCCKHSFTLLTGGAGCGKTTVIAAICSSLEALGYTSQVILLALAGKAALRITEATGREAMTIAKFVLALDQDEISDDAVIIVDEASMVDILSLLKILKRFPNKGRIILTGDEEQLPPVGVGLGLHTLVKLPLPHPQLTAIQRQTKESGIPAVAMAIRRYPQVPGEIKFEPYKGLQDGVSFIECNESELNTRALEVYQALGGNGTSNEVAMVSPVKHQIGGVDALNLLVHDSLAKGESLSFSSSDFGYFNHTILGSALRIGELVMCTVNDYERDIRNGSIGKVLEQKGNEVIIDFTGRIVNLPASKLCSLDFAYALTVHKSQGSQFDRVVVIVKQSRNLDRHMLYTAITRAKKQVVLIGDRNAFINALSQSNALNRHTLLTHHFEEHTSYNSLWTLNNASAF
jgi:exodeoxyribonuclease V alpha subunit